MAPVTGDEDREGEAMGCDHFQRGRWEESRWFHDARGRWHSEGRRGNRGLWGLTADRADEKIWLGVWDGSEREENEYWWGRTEKKNENKTCRIFFAENWKFDLNRYLFIYLKIYSCGILFRSSRRIEQNGENKI
jgi:hypothetical protein